MVGETLGLVHVVRGEHDGDTGRAQLLDQLPGGVPGLRVQAGGRLVQEDQLRPPDEGGGQREALLLSAGQPAVRGAGVLGQAQAVQQDGRVDRIGVERRHQPEELSRPGRRRHAAGLRHDADPRLQPPAVGRRVEAEHPDRARVGATEPLADLHGRGLARAVRPEQRGDRTAPSRDGEPVHRCGGAVALDQCLGLDRGDLDRGHGRVT
jgi:hypothetical protein